MSEKFTRYEPWLYLVAILVAVVFRMINLASLPLSDNEAVHALNALQLSNGSHQVGGNQPFYTMITAALFFVFGSTNFLARILPALAGCGLVVLPLLMRNKLGRLPAVILAYGLAVDPGFVALSRQAGSVMPALVLTLSAVCLIWKGHKYLAGILGGLAVLSGAGFWFGLVGLIVMTAGISLFKRRGTGDETQAQVINPVGQTAWFSAWEKKTWLAMILTILLGGSLFMIFPTGLSAVVSGFLEYIKGWYTPGAVSPVRVLVALVIYQFIPLLVGLTEGISAAMRGLPYRRDLLIGFLIFLMLVVLYPGRQMGDLSWCMIPAWVLAAWMLARLVETPGDLIVPMVGHGSLVGALMIFIILNIAWVLGGFGGLDIPRSMALLGGVIVILIISFLVAYGWGVAVAIRGAFLGLGLIAFAAMISFAVSAGGLNGKSASDLWNQDTRITGANVLENDLNEFSVWGTGVRGRLSVAVVHFDNPSMRWFLRDYQKTVFVDVLAPGSSPDVVLTDFISRPELSDNYRGETFAWYTTADWHSVNMLGMLEWVFHRKVYEAPTNIIFWVRQDLFVGGNQTISH